MFSSPAFVGVQISEGGAECFRELKVGVYTEIVPMGVDPDVVSYQLAGLFVFCTFTVTISIV